MRFRLLRAVAAAFALLAAIDSHAAPIRRYDLNGNLKDAPGGNASSACSAWPGAAVWCDKQKRKEALSSDQ